MDGQERPAAHAGHPMKADKPDILLTGRLTELLSCQGSSTLDMTAVAVHACL